MCGIVTLVATNEAPIKQNRLLKMTESLRHRGPDGFRTWVSPDTQVGMGHARLTVIDPETGWQPIVDPETGASICLNGELYNYRELKKDLIRFGFKFHTNSDSEVLLKAFLAWGPRALERLNGMFAFTIYDPRSKSLFFARDQFGVKPLYYSIEGDTLMLASELRTLAAFQNKGPRLNLEGLVQYCSMGYNLAPTTILEGIFQLPHGSCGFWRDGKLTTQRYFDLSRAANERAGQNLSFGQAVEETGELLRSSVQAQLVSDVPLGAFLSGGIDSSLVSSYARELSTGSFTTFNLDFNIPEYSEADQAKKTAKEMGSDHKCVLLKSERLIESWRADAWSSDAPIFDNSFIPTSLLCEETRKILTVVLSGDGGDELFLGYETYRADWAARHLRKFSRPSQLVLRALQSFVPTKFGKVNLSYKLRAFSKNLAKNPAAAHFGWRKISEMDLFKSPMAAESHPVWNFENILHRVPEADLLTQMSYLDCETWLPNDILVKADRAGMRHGLEVRVPFLDVKLAELALGLPDELKFQVTDPKRILKALLKIRLPGYSVNSKKKGFNAPMSEWLAGPLSNSLDHLTELGSVLEPHLNMDTVFELVQDHRSRRQDNGFILWALVALTEWWKKLEEMRAQALRSSHSDMYALAEMQNNGPTTENI